MLSGLKTSDDRRIRIGQCVESNQSYKMSWADICETICGDDEVNDDDIEEDIPDLMIYLI
jgi:hypothetical protein